MPTIYTVRRDDDGSLAAIILPVEAYELCEMRDFDGLRDLQERVKARYGQDALLVPSKKFQAEVEKRIVHTSNMVLMLQHYGKQLERDIQTFFVYGSRSRPLSASWTMIPDGIFMHTEEMNGYYTYVAVPTILAVDVIERYDLTFVSRSAVSLEE